MNGNRGIIIMLIFSVLASVFSSSVYRSTTIARLTLTVKFAMLIVAIVQTTKTIQ